MAIFSLGVQNIVVDRDQKEQKWQNKHYKKDWIVQCLLICVFIL